MVLTRIVSLSSILAACSFCGVELWRLRPSPFGDETWSLAAFSTFVPLLIIVRHRSNLGRLLWGTEPKFQFGGKSKPPSADDAALIARARPQNGRRAPTFVDQLTTMSFVSVANLPVRSRAA